MGRAEDRKIAVEKIEPDAAMERGSAVIIAGAVANRCIHTGRDARINIDERIDVRNGHDASVHERDAEIENIRVRIEVIGAGIDRLGALQGHPLPGLDVDAAREKPRQMELRPQLHRSELIEIVDEIIELAEIMRVARIGPIHKLGFNTEVVASRLWIDRTRKGQQHLIEQRLAGFIGEQMAKVMPLAGLSTLAVTPASTWPVIVKVLHQSGGGGAGAGSA